MDADLYQIKTRYTAQYPDIDKHGFLYPVLGLCGEAGEVAEKVKKAYRDRDPDMPDHIWRQNLRILIRKELGDVLWYVAQIADQFNLELSAIMRQNLQKLADRKARDMISGSGDDR